jgi:hypothetical protein
MCTVESYHYLGRHLEIGGKVFILRNKTLASMMLILGVVSIVMGGFFIFQGFSKAAMLTNAMKEEKITYAAADGSINGIIDTPTEAASMAAVLKEHRQATGIYTELGRDDPARQTILNAMVMENSLNLAQMGFGLTQVVEATGAFMILVGITLGTSGTIGLRQKSEQNIPIK